MSGGHFDYLQNRLTDIVEQLESDIKFNDVPSSETSWDEPSGPQFGEEGVCYMKALCSLCQQVKDLLDAYDKAVCFDTSEEDFIDAAREAFPTIAKIAKIRSSLARAHG